MSRVMKVVLLAGVVSCGLAAVGCASKRVDLVDAGQVSLEVPEPKQVHVWGVTVRQGSQDACVSGQVHRDAFLGQPLHGHVDVEVVQPDTSVVQRYQGPLPPLRANRSGRPGGFFHAHIPGQLPAGAAIRVRYHAGEHPEADHG